MAAGVHGAVDSRRERQSGPLGDGKGVHISTQKDSFAGLGTAQHCDDRAQTRAQADLQRQPGQGVEDLALRERQVEANLRFSVDGPAELSQLSRDRDRLVVYTCHVPTCPSTQLAVTSDDTSIDRKVSVIAAPEQGLLDRLGEYGPLQRADCIDYCKLPRGRVPAAARSGGRQLRA